MTLPIAYTMGEPAGIGVDIIILLAQTQVMHDVICVGDADCLSARAKQLGLPLRILSANTQCSEPAALRVLHQPLAQPAQCGTMQGENAQAVLTSLNTAIDGCMQHRFSALVTGPLNKALINQNCSSHFSGHTEYLAHRISQQDPSLGALEPVMMLANTQLRVALITTHLPLRKVPDAINAKRIETICTIIDTDLRHKFSIAQPKIAVCGLNPHAGEEGLLGQEEIDIISPALHSLRQKGINVIGPLPADTAFTERARAEVDIVVAMYHDQGLTAIKTLGFGSSANITLGLPIIRTSVDHGTALDLAGTGKAEIGGLLSAFNFAREMRDNVAICSR